MQLSGKISQTTLPKRLKSFAQFFQYTRLFFTLASVISAPRVAYVLIDITYPEKHFWMLLNSCKIVFVMKVKVSDGATKYIVCIKKVTTVKSYDENPLHRT